MCLFFDFVFKVVDLLFFWFWELLIFGFVVLLYGDFILFGLFVSFIDFVDGVGC